MVVYEDSNLKIRTEIIEDVIDLATIVNSVKLKCYRLNKVYTEWDNGRTYRLAWEIKDE